MRIKWNRHLDGSSSRRLEEGAEAPETEEKKRGPSSSPSIFRIFRRKKDRKRGEGEGKTDGGNGHAPPLHSEIDEDDCASISSVATCSSQPSAEAFHRDRASSLFSSFRLSLPGSKRKKRRIAPTPSETLLNGQENEPQVERYSTPDLRKQSEKLEAPINSAEISLSTSSPSIRQPPKGAFNSAQSLDVQNPEYLRWSNAKSVSPSSSKLSKSVSFSDCGDGLRDSSHSKCDNKALRTVGSVDMVEEDCGALGSELPACMSDNLRENKFTSVDDSPSSLVNDSNLHKQSGGEAIDNALMTKTEGVSNRSSGIVENRSVSQIGNILDNIASEIRCYEESNDGDKICSANSSLQRSPIASTVNSNFVNYRNGYNNEAVTDRVSTDEKSKERYAVRVNLTKSSRVQRIETGADESSVPEGGTPPERYDSSYKNSLLYSKENENTINENPHLDKIKNSEVSYLNNLPPKLSVFTAAKELCELNSCDADENNTFDVSCDMSSDDFNSDNCDVEMVKSRSSPVQKQSAITNDKHVLCHMKVYENDTLMCKAEDAKVINNSLAENPVTENCSKSLTHAEILKAKTSSIVSDNFPSETKSGDLNISVCVTNSKCDDNSEILNFPLKCDSLVNASSALNLKNKISCDQKVPDNVVPTPKYHNFRKDQVVPEFELSLLEFEEVCNKYMSRSNPEFTDCSSIIPLYCYSPKRKSVLDLNLSFTYPNFLENGGLKTSLQNSKSADLSPRRSELIKQNMKANSDSNLKNSCQILAEKLSLPLPPKQWINYEYSIEDESALNECTDGVQCTTARGKNLCQEPCLGALPTTVMLGGSDLGGIDTPQQSSTLQAFENKSGREHISIVTAEKQQLSDDRTPPKDMISNVGITISTLSGVLDYSYGSETPSKTSVYFDPEIRDTYRGPRAICDPLVYSTEVTKRLESLGTENYLNGHNFCDIRNVGLCEVINDISCDYVQGGNGLIEISNPYEEETFLLPHRNFVSASLPNDPSNTICDRKDINPEVCGRKEIFSEISSNEQLPEKEKSIAVNMLEISNVSSGNKVNESVLNRLTHTEQKNIINKTKSSMIPCRKKGPSDVETKRIETKLKSRKSNSLPRFVKSESHLPVKSNSSHRVLSSSYKDSDVGQIHGKRKDSSANKPSGNHPHVSPTTYYSEVIASVGNSSELNYNSHREEATICESLEISVLDKGNKTSSIYSSYVLLPTDISESATGVDKNGNSYSVATHSGASVVQKNGVDSSKSALSSTDTVPSIRESSLPAFGNDVISSKHIQNSDTNISECEVPVNKLGDVKLAEFCSQCSSLNQQDDINCENCLKHSGSFDYLLRRSSLPSAGLHKTSVTSSKESLNSQLTSSSNRGKSRIPRKQPGTRGAQTSTKGPVRPPMWLSKAELTQEIQRLGTLCESRTKELNRLKMETKHVSVGFDAFAALFKYMVEDLNALSVPALSEDLGRTLKQLELTKQDLAYYEREVEEMKSHHCQELNDLSNKLFEVYQSEVAELNAKHQEEVNHLKTDHQKQIEHLTTTFDASSTETKTLHEKMVAGLEQEIINQREELQLFQEREIKDLEEKHAESSKLLQEHIEQLQKKCAELKQHSMSMEDAMRKDTDSKLQWVTAAKLDLAKEVESLKAVLEMKNKELHTLRVQNLEMEKQLEELPLAREKIKMLQARAEDLEALMIEKTKLERKLSTENQQMRDTYEKESKVNRRLSMENEELLWRLRQAENSLISGSFSEVPEFSEVEENATSPTKSPGPQMMSRSVFFTFVDKGENSSHSPRSQYKKITPGFSTNYKTSPAKSSKSPPAPSPRRSKSHSEPPQPIVNTSTPRKVAKQALNKVKGCQKRQRSGSDSGRPTDHPEVNFSSVTESMASSVSSESSVFEHRERLLEEHKEHIIHSLEILREQRSTESSVDEPAVMGKKWCSDDIKITGELSHLESEDMSRSAEFADPKTYYHMTFPVLKESGMPDCDMEDGCKNSSSNSSPMKEIASIATHSMSENNINSAVEASDTLKVMSASSHATVSTTPVVKRNSFSNGTISAENVQSEAADSDKTDNRWRTI